MNFNSWETLVNTEVGYAPYFSSTVRYRVKTKRATNVVVTGEPGEGKSYLATDIVRVLEGRTRSGKERFKLDQVVYTYSDYLRLVIHLKMGKPVVFDEPSYAMGKRDWFKELNKALVRTVESQRFKVHPLYIPIINKALLDKTLRSYLIQFQIELRERGMATVYRIMPSQATEKVYRYTFCNLEYGLFDNDLCDKDSCLGCRELPSCDIFRARYERKKASVQDTRYLSDYADTKRLETTKISNVQIEELLLPHYKLFTNIDGKIDKELMRIVAEEQCDIHIGFNRGYNIAKRLAYHNPGLFGGES